MSEGELGMLVHLDSGTLAPLLKRLEKTGYIHRSRPENNERKLYIELTEAGAALREDALSVPREMTGCLDLPKEDLIELKRILDKAMQNMEGNV